MNPVDQLEVEDAPSRNTVPESGIRSILLHVQGEEGLEERLETGLSLARAFGAHLSCVHVTPADAYVALENLGGVFVMADYIEKITEQEKELRLKVEGKLASEDVTWDYEQITGNIAGEIIGRATLADLIVTSRHPRNLEYAGSSTALIGQLLQLSRTPILVAGDGSGAVDPTGSALIGWNRTRQAANAVRASVGLLKLANKVRVLRIDDVQEDAFADTRLMGYLSRHGIHAELCVESMRATVTNHQFIAGALMSHSGALRGAYVVLGGYSRSRLGEWIFGGVTRSFLQSCPVPLVLAH